MGTVLVVDDDPIITNLVAHVLSSAGHRVISTTDSAGAIDLARGQNVDVAVVDVMMPVPDGFALVQSLHREPSLAGVAVLMLSARNAARDRVEGLKTGADDYLGKPFDSDELLLRVERLMSRAARSRPTPPAAFVTTTATPGFGRYEVHEVLGRGAMGSVFKAWDPVLKRWVAIKTLQFDRDQFPVAAFDPVAALLFEAALAAQVNHPNVVTVYDAVAGDDGPFIAMEFVDGPSLEGVICHCGRLTPGHAVTVARAVTEALVAAHHHGLIHRDVKLSNILLGADGAIKLGDFGLAGAVASMARSAGMAFGTPGYISPEALRGEAVDARSDLFALGVVIYSCLTGEAPFPGPTIPKVVSATLKTRPVDPLRLVPEVGAELSELTMRLLALDPSDRFPTARALLTALRKLPAEPWSASMAAGVTWWDPGTTSSVPVPVVTD